MFVHHKKTSICIMLFWLLLPPAFSSASAQPATNSPAPSAPAKWLTGALDSGAESLARDAKEATQSTADEQTGMAEATSKLREMQMKVAMIKSGMELDALSGPVVTGILGTFSARANVLSSQIDQLSDQIQEAGQRMAKTEASRVIIDTQIKTLKGLKQPGAWCDDIESSYEKYTAACAVFAQASDGLVKAMSGKADILKQEKGLIDGLLPVLKARQQAFMPGLLQHGRSKPFLQQLDMLWHRLAVLPGQAAAWLRGLARSAPIKTYLGKKWPPLLGLFLFIGFLCWGAGRLKRSLQSLLDKVHPHTTETGVRVLIGLAGAVIATAYPILFMLWLATVYAVLWLFKIDSALIILYSLAGLTVLAVFLRAIKVLCCGNGKEKGLIPRLNPGAAPSLCRRLQLFAAFVTMGFVFVEILGLDSFPITLKLLVTQIYDIGVLSGTCALLRPGYVRRIIDGPISPKCSQWLRVLWYCLLSLLIVICLMELLGFQSFSIYTIRAAVLTEALVACVLLLAVTGIGVLREIFEREHVLLRLFGEVGLQMRQLYFPARLLLSALLIAAFISGLLLAWGIGVTSLLAFAGRLGQGVNLGCLHLSPLTILASGFVLFVGFRGSGVFRKFLRGKVFPRTGWDLGVQYSIATILQYTIIIAGVLLAMNILGFPLASLTLLAGAIGIGAGLGLQNVIANFVSGLVLLFERPVKVGDTLIVDGHWGEVKAIKMRSTVFQTLDRSILIIPNSDLLSGKIVNWSHDGIGLNRLTLTVGVSYSSDVTMVTRLLHEICTANSRVLKDPPPQIFFEAYGDSSLDFSIRVFVRKPSERSPVTHEINTAIFEAFRDKGIEIPFPQRDLHIIDDRKASLTEEEEARPCAGRVL